MMNVCKYCGGRYYINARTLRYQACCAARAEALAAQVEDERERRAEIRKTREQED